MLEEIKKDIEAGKIIYLTIKGYNGSIRVYKENLILINNEIMKVKGEDRTFCISRDGIIYYDV